MHRAITKNSDSHLWKELSRIWHYIGEGSSWSIADCATAYIWKDVWLDEERLIKHVFDFIAIDQNAKVRDMMDRNGGWELSILRHSLRENFSSKILVRHPLFKEAGPDWRI